MPSGNYWNTMRHFMNFFKHLFSIFILVGVIIYNYGLTQNGGYEEAFRNPLFVIILCCLGILVSLFWLSVEIAKILFRNNEKILSRLNGDFWTIILGPVKDQSHSD